MFSRSCVMNMTCQNVRERAGIQDAGLTKTQVQMTKMHEVPFSDGILANNATQACPLGLQGHLVQPISQRESTAKQELHQLDACSKQEPNVKILWYDSRMMAFHIRSTVPCATPRARFLFVNPRHQNTERSVDVLHRSRKFGLQSYEKSSLNRTPHIFPTIDFRSQVLNVFDRRCGIGLPVFELAPVGHERLFSVISCKFFQFKHVTDCTPYTNTVSSLPLSSLLFVFLFFLSLSTDTQLSCTILILSRARTWIE